MSHGYKCKKCGKRVWCMGFRIYACALNLCQECLDKKIESAGDIEKVLEQEGIKSTYHELWGTQYRMLWTKEDLEEFEREKVSDIGCDKE